MPHTFKDMCILMEQDQNEGFWSGAAAGAMLGAAALAPVLAGHKSNTTADTQPAKQVAPAAAKVATTQPAVNQDTKYYADYISVSEGRSAKVYLDGSGYPTIGIGHLMTPQSKLVFKLLFDDAVDYDALMAKTATLSDAQIDKLFEYDVQKHLKQTKALFPKFDQYPLYLRAALLDSVYRGEQKAEYRTVKLINSGNFREAASNYLNRKDYQQAKETGKNRGIITRMNRNQQAMLKYATELEAQAK